MHTKKLYTYKSISKQTVRTKSRRKLYYLENNCQIFWERRFNNYVKYMIEFHPGENEAPLELSFHISYWNTTSDKLCNESSKTVYNPVSKIELSTQVCSANGSHHLYNIERYKFLLSV